MGEDSLFKYLKTQIGEFSEDSSEEFSEDYLPKTVIHKEGKILIRLRDGRMWCPSRQFRGESIDCTDENVERLKIALNPTYNFTAVDFETATTDRMICQVGIIKVVNGVVKDRISKLVRPPENRYDKSTIKVHHITPEMTAHSPTFDQIWDSIKGYFIDTVVVAHNSSFDESALLKNLKRYQINNEGIHSFVCTYKLYGMGLKRLCSAFGIEASKHHDALFDAMCCAQFYLNYLNGVKPDSSLLNKPTTIVKKEAELPIGFLDYSTNDLIASVSPIPVFLNKKFIITGETIFDREWAYQLIEKAGGKRLSSVSNRLAYAVIGRSPGPKKWSS